MTYYFLENFEEYILETLVQIESNSRPFQSWLMLFLTKANEIGLNPVMTESVAGLDD